jgi:hypothetical protein
MNKKPALFFINAKFSNKNLIKLEKFLTQNWVTANKLSILQSMHGDVLWSSILILRWLLIDLVVQKCSFSVFAACLRAMRNPLSAIMVKIYLFGILLHNKNL